MPITVIPAPPGNFVGPGIGLQISSDFIGPMPEGSYYTIDVVTTPGEFNIWHEQVIWNPGNRIYWLGTKFQTTELAVPARVATDGEAVNVAVGLWEPTGQVDSGSVNATWSTTVGLGAQIALTPTSSSAPSNDPRIDQILAAVIRRLEDQR